MSDNSEHLTDAAHHSRKAVHDVTVAASEVAESIAQPIAQAVGEKVDEVREAAPAVGKAVKDQLDRAGRTARDVYRSARKTGEEWEDAARKSIRRTPVTTVLAAAGIGALIGFTLGRASAGETHSSRFWH